jgi:hypothetical protein
LPCRAARRPRGAQIPYEHVSGLIRPGLFGHAEVSVCHRGMHTSTMENKKKKTTSVLAKFLTDSTFRAPQGGELCPRRPGMSPSPPPRNGPPPTWPFLEESHRGVPAQRCPEDRGNVPATSRRSAHHLKVSLRKDKTIVAGLPRVPARLWRVCASMGVMQFVLFFSPPRQKRGRVCARYGAGDPVKGIIMRHHPHNPPRNHNLPFRGSWVENTMSWDCASREFL